MEKQTLDNIGNILTLRYTPTDQFLLPMLTWKDYLQKINENYELKTESILKNNIKNFIENEQPTNVSIALSGGVDSNLTLTLLKELYPDLNISAISFGFDETDHDVKKAKEISYKFDIDFEPVFFDNFMNNLPEQISIIKEPKINYYWYSVAKKAKEKSDILFTGDGADELFGGYVFRYSKYLKIVKNSSSWKDKVKAYLECHNRDWVPDQQKMFGPKASFSWEKIYKIFKPYFDNKIDDLDQIFLADYMGKLMFDWMPSYEKIYNHLNLKGFSPMLDPTLIKYCAKIPGKEKYDRQTGVGKLILRKILKKKNISVDSSKKGFTPNFPLFWDNYGKEITSSYLNDSRIVRDSWISQNWINNAIKNISESNDIRYINKLLHVISFEIWYRLFITKEMTPSDKLL
ncbi:MAG TPA: asparagine synthase C-terminal domain-containing protein [Candidatus Paceibacterota bacterium]|nr:asparagine synthase C-terminal domain-containing protein [Candidatus Paceibacterota bacterium]